jgi:soluble lytic murein transglycosylase
MQKHPSRLLVLLLCLVPSFIFANAPAEKPDREAQRAHFLLAEKAIKNDDPAYAALRKKLIGYPLLPYLDFQKTVKNLKRQTPEQIRASLKSLSDTPLRDRLLNQWLALLAQEGLWHSYLSFSQPGGSVTRQCHRLQAQIRTGKLAQAYAQVAEIWLSGRSQPDACDPVFEAWIDAGLLTEELVWQRVALAMEKGRPRLANYLKRFLASRDSLWVDKWISLYQQPDRVSRVSLGKSHPMFDDMVTQAVRRLAWRDVDAAFEAWQRLSAKLQFSDWQALQVARSLMGQLARQESRLSSQQVTALLPKRYLHLDAALAEKQLHYALQSGDWQLVLLTVKGLPKKEQNALQWRYWQARALLSLGRVAEGEAILKTLSGDRSYYGFLAAQRLGDQPSLQHEKLDADPALIEQLKQHPALGRAYELHRLGRSLQARREWNLALRQGSKAELRAAARLAQAWDWPSQAILTLTRLRQWNDLELRFPLAHRREITSQTRLTGLDKAWVYAILRQESAFMEDAKSRVGARGLMQLMPKTAASVAKELQLPKHHPDDLFNPELNIRLGTGYLNKVLKRLNQHPVLATAAYNAGPWRVESWLPKQAQAVDIWIETVPFRETREYLKRVLAYTVIYNYRLGEDSNGPPSRWLQPIKSSLEKNAAPLTDV